jgi:hypothetical protein
MSLLSPMQTHTCSRSRSLLNDHQSALGNASSCLFMCLKRFKYILSIYSIVKLYPLSVNQVSVSNYPSLLQESDHLHEKCTYLSNFAFLVDWSHIASVTSLEEFILLSFSMHPSALQLKLSKQMLNILRVLKLRLKTIKD